MIFDSRISDRTARLINRCAMIVLYAVIGAWLVYQISTSTMFYSEYPRFKGIVSGQTLLIAVSVVAVCLEVAHLVERGLSKKDLAAYGIALVMLIPPATIGHTTYASAVVLILMARNADLKKLMLFCLVIMAACLAAVLLASWLQLLPDHVAARGTKLRHYLGFRYCLFPSMYLFIISCMWCFVRDEKITWVELAVLLAANGAMFWFTDGRISLGTSIALIVLVSCRKIFKSADWKKVARPLAWITVATVLVTVAVVGIYAVQIQNGATWLNELDVALGGRIKLTYNGLVDIGTTLLGQKVHWVAAALNSKAGHTPGAYNYVDNMYMYSLITLGWIYTLGMIALITQTARKAASTGEIVLVFIFAVIAIHSVIDDTTMRLYFDPFLFAIGPMLMGWTRKRPETAIDPQ